MIRMRFSCLFGALACGVLVFATGCGVRELGGLFGSGDPEGTGDSGQVGSPTERDCDAPFEPFSERDSWTILSDSDSPEGRTGVMITGFGGEIDSIMIGPATFLGPGEQPSCFLAASDVSVRFDENEVTIVGTATDDASDGTCGIELRGTISRCGTPVFLGPGLDVFDMEVEGHTTLAGERTALGVLQLMRIRVPEPTPCEDVPTSLAGMGWSLTSTDPLASFGPPPDADVFIDISGTDETVQYAGIYERGDFDERVDPEPLLDCFGESPEGTVFLDGDTLTVAMQLENEFDEAAEACSLAFTGTVADCSISEFFGDMGGDLGQRVMRIEGEGAYSGAGREGSITTLYLFVTEASAMQYPE